MAQRSAGFSSKALAFFRELEKNNDRKWFAAHKELYEEEVRRPMVELTASVCDVMRGWGQEYVPERPEKAIYRIYRDTRFSKDKTPYKTHIGAHLQHRRIEKNAGSGFYFQISHRGVGLGGGMYMPGPEQLRAVRRVLAERWREMERICSGRALVKALGPLQGEKLARIPKGSEVTGDAGEWLRYKQFYFYTELPAKVALGPGIYKEIVSRLKPLVPVNRFLNDAVIAGLGEESREDDDGRPVRPETMF